MCGRLLLLAAVSLGLSGLALGQESEADLAKATQNPVSDLISVPFQNNMNFGVGPDDRIQNVLNIQPVIPLSMTENWNLITRTILPVTSQPVDPRVNGLGDLSFSAFLSPKKVGKVIWGAGPVALLPTATNDALGADKWGLGPSVVVLAMPGNWVVGSLWNNIWSVGGSGERDVNLFTWQYFINYNFPRGWYFSSAPIMTANWEAESGNQWTVPLGGGVGKIFRMGRQPMNAQVHAYYNVVSPEAGADWQLRLQLQFLFPK